MEDKEHESLDLLPGRPHSRGDDLAELQALDALRERLQIMRVVVLAVDEDDLLRPPGNIEIALVKQREIARSQPPVGGEGLCVRPGILEVPASDVVATHVKMSDPALRQRLILVIGNAHAAIRNRAALGYQPHRIA